MFSSMEEMLYHALAKITRVEFIICYLYLSCGVEILTVKEVVKIVYTI